MWLAEAVKMTTWVKLLSQDIPEARLSTFGCDADFIDHFNYSRDVLLKETPSLREIDRK